MKVFLVSSILVIILSLYFIRSRNNVCKTFDDYYTNRDSNENCYYNPEAYLNVDEIIKRRGYPLEIHNVITQDGYIITIFRIPHGKNESSITKGQSKQPVFLLHGGGLNSESYVNTGKKSLGFILADAGYDVWLGSYRGTKYGRNHTKLSNNDMKFWDFSFHEMGTHDVPAQIDLVSDITKQKIIYIGFSLGTMNAFIYGSAYPEIAKEKIKVFICLAPAAFLYKWKSPTKFLAYLWPYVKSTLDWFTVGKVYLRQPPHILREILCLPFPFQMRICQFTDMVALGFNYEQNDPETLPITLLQNSDASSTKTVAHVCQLVTNEGEFRQYDYGRDENKKLYGMYEPPTYELSKFSVPVYFIRSENDLIITKENVEKLNSSLPENVKPYDIYVVKSDKFNHGDFIFARDIVPLLYDHILEVITKF